MDAHAFTVVIYRVKPDAVETFVHRWEVATARIGSLPHAPLGGTLIRHASDPFLFYWLGPWRTLQDVQSMRESRDGVAAWDSLAALCDGVQSVDCEVVTNVKT